MSTTHDQRRHLLRLTALAAASAALRPGLVLAAAEPLAVQTLGDDAWVLSTPYGNVLALRNAAGLLLVDGLREDDTPALLAALEQQTGSAAVNLLYNTHWHEDHTGSNETLRDGGARIVAHENTRLWLTNPFYAHWEQRQYQPRPPQALPTETFYEQHSETFGDETIDSGLLFQAHTDGDIYVLLRERNILATGDLVINGGFPVLDPATGGWLGALTTEQARLLELADDDTRIMPGRGALMTRAELRTYHEQIVTLRERIYACVREGKGPREMLAEDVAAGYETWGDPTLFVMSAYPGLGRHYREVDGVV